jgi:hypothetical protein
LIVGRTIHCAQGLTLDHLAFHPFNVIKHSLTYTTLFGIHSKEHLYFLSPLLNKIFHIDSIFEQKMLQLKTTTQYNLPIPNLNFYNFLIYNHTIP